MTDIKFTFNESKLDEIYQHLFDCSDSFVPKLSSYVNLDEYSSKIYQKSFRIEAFNNNKLVGLIAVYINTNSLYITNVSVLPDFQNLKIADKIMKKCIEKCQELSITKLILEVRKENIKALSFYNKRGFKISTEKENTYIMILEIKRNYDKEFRDTSDHKYAYSFDFDVMHPYMIKSFEPFFKGNDVLELGSFKGDFTARLFPYFSDITCVEASEEAINEAKIRFGNKVNFYRSLFEDLILPKKYNNIILTHVLEHIDNPVELLKKIKDEWLTEDGKLFIVCPNANAPSRQIAVKMGLITHNSAITPSEKEHGHRITYTLDTLERDAKDGGLKVLYRSGIFFKALANFQWDALLKTDIISKEYLDGCFDLGQQYPDLCSSIMLICKK